MPATRKASCSAPVKLPATRIARTAAALLGVDAVRLWHDQALYKESGGRETDPHQDLPYWPIAEPTTVTAPNGKDITVEIISAKPYAG